MERKNVAWNMIGSLIYSGSTMVLTALVNHLVGAYEGGIFGFAFTAFGQQMFLVAYFGLRPLQSTDIGRNYTFGEYRMARFITSMAACVFGSLYILWNLFVPETSYSGEKAAVVFLMVLYKVLDGFADVYESEFQRNGHLYLTGQAMAYRTLLSVCCFLGVLFWTRHLVISCMAAVASQAVGILLFDKKEASRLPGIDFTRQDRKHWKLLQDGFLLFLSVFLDGLIFAMAKYAVDAKMTSKDSAVFVAIFMPTSIIYLAANFIIRPFLNRMSYQWGKRHFTGLYSDLRKLLVIIGGLTVIALTGAWFLGVPVLGFISNVDLIPYKPGLLYIILGGGFFAAMNLFYYVLVIMKCQRRIFFGYVPVCLFSFFLSFEMVGRWGINGGAFSYMLEMLLLMMCFMGQSIYVMNQEKKIGGGKDHG